MLVDAGAGEDQFCIGQIPTREGYLHVAALPRFAHGQVLAEYHWTAVLLFDVHLTVQSAMSTTEQCTGDKDQKCERGVRKYAHVCMATVTDERIKYDCSRQ